MMIHATNSLFLRFDMQDAHLNVTDKRVDCATGSRQTRRSGRAEQEMGAASVRDAGNCMGFGSRSLVVSSLPIRRRSAQ